MLTIKDLLEEKFQFLSRGYEDIGCSRESVKKYIYKLFVKGVATSIFLISTFRYYTSDTALRNDILTSCHQGYALLK